MGQLDKYPPLQVAEVGATPVHLSLNIVLTSSSVFQHVLHSSLTAPAGKVGGAKLQSVPTILARASPCPPPGGRLGRFPRSGGRIWGISGKFRLSRGFQVV